MSPIISRLLFGVGLALVLLACSVDAHAWMSNPKPRGQYLPTPKYPYMEYGPAAHDPNNTNFVCRGDPASPKATYVPLKAGESQAITISFNAFHVGDCFVYLSYDGDKPTSEQKWFKIWEQHSCKDQSNYNIPIPSYLPSGDHVVFRWEWYALHIYPTVEYFASCFDASITGKAEGTLPSPQVNIPGHLPVLSGNYADNTNNYWWPWDNQPMFFTGPPVATLSGQVAPTSAATKAPTVRPPNAEGTTKPISTATVAPAKQASATAAPVADAPTQAPATQAPAKPATAAPAATQAPAAPATDAPKPSTTVAPAQSVKLDLGSSTTWWLSVVPQGHRASEVVKMEVMDSGSYTSFKTMDRETYSSPNRFTFNAASGELKLPLTIKTSLASGSALTFTVNSFNTIVDSGALFR